MTNTTTGCTYMGTASSACGCTALEGRSYCQEHYSLVYQVGTARARRKKDLKVAARVWDLESEFNAAVEELIMEGWDINEDRWDCAVEES